MTTHSTFRVGMAFAIASALTFGTSGPFAKALMEAGWTPIAAVTARMAAGAVTMAAFATVVHRGWLREAWRHRTTILMYGVVPVAGAQLCYYSAVAHLSVGVALLLEYLAPVLVVGFVWTTTRRRPATLTLLGAGLALTGTFVVLDVFSGARINAVGVTWALGAAVCAACYYVMSGQVATSEDELHPVTLCAGGLIVGAVTVAALGASRVLPMRFTANDTIIAGHTVSALVPIAILGIVSTAAAYALGIYAIVRLRPSYASLVGLGEVLAAVTWAWLVIGEAITPIQAIGGVVVLIGLALAGIGSGDHRMAETTWPDIGSASNLADHARLMEQDEVSSVGDRRELVGEQQLHTSSKPS